MSRVIEVMVSPTGEATVQTRGYAGADCLRASQFLEQALGLTTNERKTAEFYQPQDGRQDLRHQTEILGFLRRQRLAGEQEITAAVQAQQQRALPTGTQLAEVIQGNGNGTLIQLDTTAEPTPGGANNRAAVAVRIPRQADSRHEIIQLLRSYSVPGIPRVAGEVQSCGGRLVDGAADINDEASLVEH